MPVFFSFAQVREDLARHTVGLTEEQVWLSVGANSLGYQVKHIAGSVDRITSYLMDRALSASQLAFLKEEGNPPPADLPGLLGLVEGSLAQSETELMSIDPSTLYAPRMVGRKHLPTTVIGLIVHLAEHTQRHLGQAVTIATLLRQLPE